MENDTLLKGVRIPEQGFIEIQISSDGNVILTGESVRYDDHDYYRPVGPALIGSAIPAVDAVEVVHAAWIEAHWDNRNVCCSACGYEVKKETRFCPDCGARMEGEEEHNAKAD